MYINLLICRSSSWFIAKQGHEKLGKNLWSGIRSCQETWQKQNASKSEMDSTAEWYERKLDGCISQFESATAEDNQQLMMQPLWSPQTKQAKIPLGSPCGGHLHRFWCNRFSSSSSNNLRWWPFSEYWFTWSLHIIYSYAFWDTTWMWMKYYLSNQTHLVRPGRLQSVNLKLVLMFQKETAYHWNSWPATCQKWWMKLKLWGCLCVKSFKVDFKWNLDFAKLI